MFRSDRLGRIPPYLFAELDRIRADAVSRGVDVISLGIGDPDIPTPEPIVEALREASRKGANHRYPPYEGTASFREAVARYYKRKYKVDLDPAKEVIALIGSKEGIAHISLAVLNPGDVTLVPDPGYPVYSMGALLAGGEPYAMPLLPGRGFKPDLSALPQEVLEKARMLFLNYPNNPTAAVADSAYFEEVISFARKAGILVCHDHSYNEVVLEGDEPPSILQVDGAMDWAMEFGSLSKPYNMTGWRLGYAVGRSEVIEALGTVKNNIDSGVFMAVQDAGVFALDNGEPFIRKMRQVYLRRRDLVAKTLSETGFRVSPPKATFYLWVPVPEGFSSKEFCMHLLSTLGIMVTPGNGYGASGEGYFRISLTAPDDRISEAMERWKRLELKTRAVPA